MNRLQIAKIIGQGPPEKLIVENQSTGDIVHQVIVKHKACTADYDRIIHCFEGGDIYQIAEKLYNFCRQNLKYYEEPEEFQYVSAPYTILTRGYSDCKCYALFIAGVLDAMKRLGYEINWKFRFVSYKPWTALPGHVFVVVMDGEDEIWIDPVLKAFNWHKPYMFELDKKVRTRAQVGNCGCEPAKVGNAGTAYNVGPGDIPLPNGYPAYLPVPYIKNGALKLHGTYIHAQRPPTNLEVSYVVSALQNWVDKYGGTNRYDLFSTVTPGGKTVGGIVYRLLDWQTYDPLKLTATQRATWPLDDLYNFFNPPADATVNFWDKFGAIYGLVLSKVATAIDPAYGALVSLTDAMTAQQTKQGINPYNVNTGGLTPVQNINQPAVQTSPSAGGGGGLILIGIAAATAIFYFSAKK
jgi:hypothetical protein